MGDTQAVFPLLHRFNKIGLQFVLKVCKAPPKGEKEGQNMKEINTRQRQIARMHQVHTAQDNFIKKGNEEYQENEDNTE